VHTANKETRKWAKFQYFGYPNKTRPERPDRLIKDDYEALRHRLHLPFSKSG
jgi:hypothetical protein